jgi:hypothetical protein
VLQKASSLVDFAFFGGLVPGNLQHFDELVERRVEVSEAQEFDWGSFVFFSDRAGTAGSCSSCLLAIS